VIESGKTEKMGGESRNGMASELGRALTELFAAL
jgi:hypothetical protein